MRAFSVEGWAGAMWGGQGMSSLSSDCLEGRERKLQAWQRPKKRTDGHSRRRQISSSPKEASRKTKYFWGLLLMSKGKRVSEARPGGRGTQGPRKMREARAQVPLGRTLATNMADEYVC